MRILAVVAVLGAALASSSAGAGDWPQAVAPVIPAADGYVAIPGAAVPPERGATYRAIFDATQGAAKPSQLVPAINMVGSELNALAAAGVPLEQAKFVVVFHGAAMSGLLDDAHFRSRFGVPNPNLAVLDQLARSGVELFVCGQNVAADKLDPKALAPQVRIASDALIVLMTYQSRGYALLKF
jgi:intracellular sulfur oxidation DsrE/DsrF family protein